MQAAEYASRFVPTIRILVGIAQKCVPHAPGVQSLLPDDLRRFTGPKFAIVTPRNDAPLSLHHAVPGIPHAVIDGTGHWIHLDKPDEFNRVLDGFLTRVEA